MEITVTEKEKEEFHKLEIIQIDGVQYIRRDKVKQMLDKWGDEVKELIETGWKVTDSSCNQMMKQLAFNKFKFKEDRIVNPETKETETYESIIDLSKYTQDEMFKNVEPFGYSFNEMCTWIDEGYNLDIIAECIFEMEN